MESINTLQLFLEHNTRIESYLPYSLFINGFEYYIIYNRISKNCTGSNYITKDKLNISKIKKFDDYIFEKVYKNGFIYRKHKSTPSPASLLNNLFNKNVQDNLFKLSDVSKTVYNPYYRKGVLISLFNAGHPNNNVINECSYNSKTSNKWNTSLVDISNSSTYKTPIVCPPYIARWEGLNQRIKLKLPLRGQQGRVISFSYIDASIVNNNPIHNDRHKYIGNFGNLFILYDNYNSNTLLDKTILGSFTRDGWTDHRDISLDNNKRIIPGGGLFDLSIIALNAPSVPYFWCKWLLDNSANNTYDTKKIKDIFNTIKDKCTKDLLKKNSCGCCSNLPSKCGLNFYTNLSAGLDNIYKSDNSCSLDNPNCWNEILIKSWTFNELGLEPSANNIQQAKQYINDTSLISNLGWNDIDILNQTPKIPILVFGVLNDESYNKYNYYTHFNLAQLNILTANTDISVVYLDTSNNKFTDINKNTAQFTNKYTPIVGKFKPHQTPTTSWDYPNGCCANQCLFKDNSPDYSCIGESNINSHSKCSQICNENLNCGAFYYDKDNKNCLLYDQINISPKEPGTLEAGYTYIKEISGVPFIKPYNYNPYPYLNVYNNGTDHGATCIGGTENCKGYAVNDVSECEQICNQDPNCSAIVFGYNTNTNSSDNPTFYCGLRTGDICTNIGDIMCKSNRPNMPTKQQPCNTYGIYDTYIKTK